MKPLSAWKFFLWLAVVLVCCVGVNKYASSATIVIQGPVLSPAAGGGGLAEPDGEALVSNSTVQGTNVSTYTWVGKTTAGANRLGEWKGAWYNGGEAITSITWGGVAMTKAEDEFEVTGWGVASAIYYIVNPPTGASDIVVTWNSTCDMIGVVSSYKGVDQSTPAPNVNTAVTTMATDDPLTITVTSTAGALVSDVWGIDAGDSRTFTFGPGQTEQKNLLAGPSTGNAHMVASREAAVGTSTVMSWTHTNANSHRAGVAVSYKPAP